jgi:hypothetical protein
VGFALLPAIGLLAWRRRALAPLLLAPALFALYPLYLWWKVGDAWAFARSQEIWHRHVSLAGPLGGAWEGIRAVFRAGRPHDTAVNLEALVALALFGALAVVAWRHLGAAYGLFAAAALAIPLAVPSTRYPLLSLPRFGLVVFPLFLALAVLGARQRVHTATVCVSAAFLGVMIVQWVQWQWVS